MKTLPMTTKVMETINTTSTLKTMLREKLDNNLTVINEESQNLLFFPFT